jgi:hypothetical protein
MNHHFIDQRLRKLLFYKNLTKKKEILTSIFNNLLIRQLLSYFFQYRILKMWSLYEIKNKKFWFLGRKCLISNNLPECQNNN